MCINKAKLVKGYAQLSRNVSKRITPNSKVTFNLTPFLIGHFLRHFLFFTIYRIYIFHTIYMVFIGDLANICTINSTNTVSIRKLQQNLQKCSFLSQNVINAIFDCRLVQNIFCHKQ